MSKIENEQHYNWAVARVGQLLPDTPRTDPNSIELELLSNLVANYSVEHYTIGRPSALSIIQKVMTTHHITEPVLY